MPRDRDGLVEKYVEEIRRNPVLSASEEKTLAREYVRTKDPVIAQRLALSSLRFVVKISYDYVGFTRKLGIPFSDLIQEGSLGLMHAITKFDPERGLRLVQYAAWWIRAYIRVYIRKYGSAVNGIDSKSSRRENASLSSAIPKAYSISTLLAYPDDSEGSEMDPHVSSDHRHLFSVDSVAPGVLNQKEVSNSIHSGMARLSDRERDILFRYYLTDEETTYEEIGKRWRISRERVRQLHNSALHKLKESVVV